MGWLFRFRKIMNVVGICLTRMYTGSQMAYLKCKVVAQSYILPLSCLGRNKIELAHVEVRGEQARREEKVT